MSLSSRQIKHLRGLSHRLSPVVTVADKGLSEAVREEIENALEHHELIKIRFRRPRDERKELIRSVAEAHRAVLVQSIGQVASFYRENREKTRIELPRSGPAGTS